MILYSTLPTHMQCCAAFDLRVHQEQEELWVYFHFKLMAHTVSADGRGMHLACRCARCTLTAMVAIKVHRLHGLQHNMAARRLTSPPL